MTIIYSWWKKLISNLTRTCSWYVRRQWKNQVKIVILTVTVSSILLRLLLKNVIWILVCLMSERYRCKTKLQGCMLQRKTKEVRIRKIRLKGGVESVKRLFLNTVQSNTFLLLRKFRGFSFQRSQTQKYNCQ